MSETLTEESRALIRVMLDHANASAPGPKTLDKIRIARNEVGYPTRREEVYYDKLKASWHE
jgi:hypothetical protein